MARDGTVRGGTRIGAGRKSSSKSANLPVFEADFDPKNAVFDPKSSKKRSKKSEKCSDSGIKTAENAPKASENTPKTSKTSAEKVKSESKTSEKLVTGTKSVKKTVSNLKKSASEAEKSGQVVKKTVRSSGTSAKKLGSASKSSGKSAYKSKAAPKAAGSSESGKGKRSVGTSTKTKNGASADVYDEPCVGEGMDTRCGAAEDTECCPNADTDHSTEGETGGSGKNSGRGMKKGSKNGSDKASGCGAGKDEGCGAEESDNTDIGSDSEDVDYMEDDDMEDEEDVSDSSDSGRTGTPHVDEYMRAQQKCGKKLKADIVYKRTIKWLRSIKCSKVVSNQLVKQYAMSVARWIQTEELISETGFLSKHPTTGQSIASPYVAMSQNYMKQVNQLWYQIYQIVKENCSEGVLANSDDPMERLLRERGG